jgi:hypothetical protein
MVGTLRGKESKLMWESSKGSVGCDCGRSGGEGWEKGADGEAR